MTQIAVVSAPRTEAYTQNNSRDVVILNPTPVERWFPKCFLWVHPVATPYTTSLSVCGPTSSSLNILRLCSDTRAWIPSLSLYWGKQKEDSSLLSCSKTCLAEPLFWKPMWDRCVNGGDAEIFSDLSVKSQRKLHPPDKPNKRCTRS